MRELEPELLSGDVENFLERSLLWRPPMPVDNVDISHIERLVGQMETTEPGYAWERLPRWLTAIDDTFKKASEVPVVHFDLCSSVPLYAQMMRGLECKRSQERATEIVANIFRHRVQGDELVPSEYEDLHNAIGRNKHARELLNSAVQEVLYTRNSEDMADGNMELSRQKFARRLGQHIASQDTTYVVDRDSKDSEGRWQIKFFSVPAQQSYGELLELTPVRTKSAIMAGQRMSVSGKNTDDIELAKERGVVDKEIAQGYLSWQSEEIAKGISGNVRYRPARFISLDIGEPEDIAVSSLANTPVSTKNMHLYSHALRSLFEPNQHLVADIFEPLPVPDNSITLITCLDAWPFYSSFEGLSQDAIDVSVFKAVETIGGWYNKLAFGGKMVIFPWAIQAGDMDSVNTLSEVVGLLSLAFGHGVNETVFHRSTLLEFMSEADRDTAERLSAIFSADTSRISALIIEKPHKTLVDRHTSKLASRLLTATGVQIQGLPDPTP